MLRPPPSTRPSSTLVPHVITSSTFDVSGSGSGSAAAQRDNVLVRTAISLEYALLRNINHCPLGMYILPSPASFFVWDGVFFIHQGYYADSVFKFRITFPQTFPDHPPSVEFVTEVFHPLVSHAGAFNLGYHYKQCWCVYIHIAFAVVFSFELMHNDELTVVMIRADEHHIIHILHWIKTSFKKSTLDKILEGDCYNKEAFRLYRDSTSSFANLAAQSAQLSSSDSVLFDTDDRHPKRRARQGVSSGSGSGSVRSNAGAGWGRAGSGSMSRLNSTGSGIGGTVAATGTAGPGLMFERLDVDELRVERERLGVREWVV
ncbi:ubiquitin-conjugating enzyme/RWD-like protein [Panaeolus papilionaceus]|nr:ubiquitin-conjugating enzyme/RWD-like protein [Panaeolus papilionaceus]